uniref:uncharacterized protein LOC120340948 n=1 Tax=Styela clava TaxID=7725 RepID=UPI00193A6DD2|nr:uncharacterized protein LOC120340948 [Styela clava]
MDVIQQLSSNTEERRKLVYATNVALTDLVWDEREILGRIGVHNLAYEKHVSSRITFNQWENFADVEAFWEEGDNSIDLFSFRVTWPEESTNAIFALRAVQNGCTFWDNNNQSNYAIPRIFTLRALSPPLDSHERENLDNLNKTDTGQLEPTKRIEVELQQDHSENEQIESVSLVKKSEEDIWPNPFENIPESSYKYTDDKCSEDKPILLDTTIPSSHSLETEIRKYILSSEPIVNETQDSDILQEESGIAETKEEPKKKKGFFRRIAKIFSVKKLKKSKK